MEIKMSVLSDGDRCAGYRTPRATYYNIADGDGVSVWTGGLTDEGEIFSNGDPFPRELKEDMTIEIFDPGDPADSEAPWGFFPISEHQTIQVWKKMIEATWMRPSIPS